MFVEKLFYYMLYKVYMWNYFCDYKQLQYGFELVFFHR